MIKIFLIISIWLAFGLAGSGFSNAYFTTRYPTCHAKQDLGTALLMSISGPINLAIGFLLSGFGEYGWTLKVNNASNCDH